MNRKRLRVVVSESADARDIPAELVLSADDYLETGEQIAQGTVVINLCRDSEYGTKGYYVSLLADARGHRVLPSTETRAALEEPYARFRGLQEAGVATIDAGEMTMRRRSAGSTATLARSARPIVRAGGGELREASADEVEEVIVCMGTCTDARFRAAAREAYLQWPAPLLRLQLVHEDAEWKVSEIALASPAELDRAARRLLAQTLADPARALRTLRDTTRETVRASIAVLMDESDPFSPSSPETIDRLERAADRMNVHIARIGLTDLRRLPEYDALFVRGYTGVTHPAFQFALRAEALGMPVIDSPQATIRCTNKVFVHELLQREGIPTPKTRVLTADSQWENAAQIGLPFVVKQPDGCFSAAVHKVESREQYEQHAHQMFESSPLIIAQEWLPTEFDWRIGVLGGKVLFAARYHMARGHWQIRAVNGGKERYGRVEAVPRADAPVAVTELALRTAALIGDGLFGVDIKETAHGPVVIEINDNPNLDAGYEDAADGDDIYTDLVQYFLERIESSDAVIEAPSIRGYRAFQVTGIELEYPTVDTDLNVVSLVEPAFRKLAGRGTSDVELGPVSFSNEFADHVFEIKTTDPVASLRQAETILVEGVQRFSEVLKQEFDARLLPTGMHPWFDPRAGRLWTRSGLRIYTTYARLFNVRTHGWMNVQASHINLPFGDERETIAMHTAAALLVPYLPALAASTPMHDGALQDTADARLSFLAILQARLPESMGKVVPEYVDSFSAYRRDILQPIYNAIDRLPDAGALRHEFLNARGAILRFARRAMEVRVLDVQECVHMDIALAAFVRGALKSLTRRVLANTTTLPAHELLVHDFRECLFHGSRARVHAPHLLQRADDDPDGRPVRDALTVLLSLAREEATDDELAYFDDVAWIIRNGTLSERIRTVLEPHAEDRDALLREARRVYGELADCLVANTPWRGGRV